MGTWMRHLYEGEAARAAVPEILASSGEPELAARFADRLGAEALSHALGEHLDPIASTLERAAVGTDVDCHAPNTINFATALRIYGPPDARRGEPLEWRETNYPNGMIIATDHRGVEWDIAARRGAFGVTVAQWDRPDWWIETRGLAKTLVAEIVARPSFSREDAGAGGEIEIPFD